MFGYYRGANKTPRPPSVKGVYFSASGYEVTQTLPNSEQLASLLVRAASIAKASTLTRREELATAVSCSPRASGLVPLVAPLTRQALSEQPDTALAALAPLCCDLVRYGATDGTSARLPAYCFKFDETADAYSCPLIEDLSLPVPRHLFPAGAVIALKSLAASSGARSRSGTPRVYAQWARLDGLMGREIQTSPKVAATRATLSPGELLTETMKRVGVISSNRKLMAILAEGKRSRRMIVALAYRATSRARFEGWKSARIRVRFADEPAKYTYIEVEFDPVRYAGSEEFVDHLNASFDKAQFFVIKGKSK